ncbi:MAG: hypothetical protein NTX62_01830 [Deltaproteobacteria bacterium]|nr:hypothetical protein [Deltaproteobacteria bacterium]
MAIVCQGETGQKLAVCQKDDVSIHDIVIDVAKQGKVIVPLIDQGETTTAKKLITDNNTLTGGYPDVGRQGMQSVKGFFFWHGYFMAKRLKYAGS